jgi:hypothetical protein
MRDCEIVFAGRDPVRSQLRRSSETKGAGRETIVAAASMESMLKPMRSGDQDVLDKDASATPQGGVNDTYGEDAATENVAITPWARLVARFV